MPSIGGMGKLMIACPKSGYAVFTGKQVNPLTLRESPGFFDKTDCRFLPSKTNGSQRSLGMHAGLQRKADTVSVLALCPNKPRENEPSISTTRHDIVT